MRRLSPQVVLYPSGTAIPDLPATTLALPDITSAAFGDGSHPTTCLCAGAVDYLCRRSPIRAFLDVGTGTGVLARIARARGVAFVAGTDIDPQALASAARNAALDPHPVALHFAAHLPDHWGARFDLVAANILEAPLRALAPHLAAALADDGQLLLSGFTPAQAFGLRTAFTAQGLIYSREAQHEGWSLLVFQKKSN